MPDILCAGKELEYLSLETPSTAKRDRPADSVSYTGKYAIFLYSCCLLGILVHKHDWKSGALQDTGWST